MRTRPSFGRHAGANDLRSFAYLCGRARPLRKAINALADATNHFCRYHEADAPGDAVP